MPSKGTKKPKIAMRSHPRNHIRNEFEVSPQSFWAECSTQWPSAQYFRSIIQPNYHEVSDMTEPQIIVRKLSKTYRVSERDAGLRASISSLWWRAYRSVEAVRDVSFAIEAGEMVGFLGPNGAGE